jgi:hypothetical protein
MFSPDSAIDGAVLEVILNKARTIQKATGVTVPLPDERGPVTDALMNAMMLRRGGRQQLALDLRLADGTHEMDIRWRDAEENEKRSRTIFAQNAMKPSSATRPGNASSCRSKSSSPPAPPPSPPPPTRPLATA